ncbi:hypothetical protein [Hydrogenophaga sp. IBVHS1]|uniref:hypothetical protein n=1 Tax=unclassified Hydrogenophaga TaxID=2610897 RepID=UPI000A2E45E2|nr:hypothetical protein [Hydrogenophaga sp. IBVHS1]OSZ73296.1 hypothetical protein CAP37_16775 [Hydrogenophaga sp. IBVHS1]
MNDLQAALAPFQAVWSFFTNPANKQLFLDVGKAAVVIGGLFGAYLRIRAERMKSAPQLATDITSWDASSKFPIMPIREFDALASFPFIPSKLSKRVAAEDGCYTVTNIRVWNAGKGSITGPLLNHAIRISISVPTGSGIHYDFTSMLSNDPDIEMHLSRSTYNVDTQRRNISLAFDLMRPGKGILISVRHGAAHGDDIAIKTSLPGYPDAVAGTYVVFRHKVHVWMTRINNLSILPFAVASYLLFIWGYLVVGAIATCMTFTAIWTAYAARFPNLAPSDLVWDNASARLIRLK